MSGSDVLIIGGGVIGLSIAREMHKCGVKRITLVEKSVCGTESSWAAAGMLGPQAEADNDGLFYEMCSSSRELYPAFASELLDETGIDIELDRKGTLYLAFSDEDVFELRQRYEWQKKSGLKVELLAAEDVRKAEPFVSPNVREGLYFPNDWQVENRKLVTALRHYAEINGIKIIENTAVEKVTVEDRKVTGVETKSGKITAGTVILATGAWASLIQLGDFASPLKVEPVRGQIVAFQTAKRLFQHVILSRRGYLVPRADGRILAGSTTENVGFDKSVTSAAAEGLRNMANEISASLATLDIADHWSGLRPFAMDGMPILGGFDGINGLTVATAHYRNGILLAPLTAKIIAEYALEGSVSRYLATFGPDRFRLRRAGTGK